MRFHVKEWREIYNEVQRTGKMLKDSRPRWDKENKRWIPAVSPMPESEQKVLEAWIKNLLKQNNLYLDACGLKPNPPLWKYDTNDPKTWPSHKDFIYEHLLKGVQLV